tara:strand:+ start:1236 stop:1871 length:636 start_codon:yes stop_codon:yes gene_type:complete
MTLKLEVEKREASVDVVRAEGKIPAVVYGPKQEPIAIAVNKFQFEKTLQEAGESTIINLEGLDEEVEVLVQDVAFDAAKGGAEHVDFYAIERGKELTTNVAFEFVGEAPVEKSGATVTKVMQDVEVTCRPSALPSHIEVDLSVLETEDAQIHISDLIIPADVKLGVESDAVVVSVAAAREEELEETAAAVDMDAVEVEGEKKEDETEEAEV